MIGTRSLYVIISYLILLLTQIIKMLAYKRIFFLPIETFPSNHDLSE